MSPTQFRRSRLDELSPELRAQVEKALASSGASVVISETGRGMMP
jgi:hypothetical protein